MTKEKIIKVNVKNEMEKSYLDYAMSVIASRALPDVRDGLKPVHRRILHSMNDLGMARDSSYKKSARVVGDVLGKYHPHGDCLRGDTMMFLANGSFSTIEKIYKSKVSEVDILAFNPKNSNLEIRTAHSFRIGQRTDKIYSFTLSNGEKLEVTGNHPILMDNQQFKKAEDIKEGEFLYSCDLAFSTKKEYRPFIKQKNKKRKLIQELKETKEGNVVHHIDEDINNNSLENLQELSRGEHAKIHKDYEIGLKKVVDYMRDNKTEILKREKSHNIQVLRVDIIEVNQEPMYDFTVDELENMMIPFKDDSKEDAHTLICVHNSSVYDAMVRLAQDFNTRYLLVDGHGNFGSVDGDKAASMRYTEVKMAPLTKEMLKDINKDTVDFSLNFDETLQEPNVLPCRFPNLLVNGSSGIAVGMATNIPPHNLSETINGITALIDDPNLSSKELMNYIKAPDFPTGAHIIKNEEIEKAYTTGRGKIKTRAVATIEELPRGKSQIIVTEIPYQVNKARLIERIVELVKEKKIEGITNIRDESDRTGMRIVIEISKDSSAEVVLANLYKLTQLEETFGVIMLVLVDGKPKVLNLKQVLEYYIKHQIDVISRRTQYDLTKAENRNHIVEGLLVAQNNINEILKTIKSSSGDATAKEQLIKNYGLSDKQAQSILDMRLKRLTGLERNKLEEENKELLKTIKELKEILDNKQLILNILKEELKEIKEKYGDERRTKLIEEQEEIEEIDLIENEETLLFLTKEGFLRRKSPSLFTSQKRCGMGVSSGNMNDTDKALQVMSCFTHDDIYFISNKGKVFTLKAYQIPEGSRVSKGLPIVNLIPLDSGELITTMVAKKESEKDKDLLLITKEGFIKRTSFEEYSSLKNTGIIGITLKDKDYPVGALVVDDNCIITVGTSEGKTITFEGEEVRPSGRPSSGVFSIKIPSGVEITGVVAHKVEDLNGENSILTIGNAGIGKRSPISDFSIQKRGGMGIIGLRTNKKNNELTAIKKVSKDDEVLLLTEKGLLINLKASELTEQGRATTGYKIIDLKKDDRVVSVEVI